MKKAIPLLLAAALMLALVGCVSQSVEPSVPLTPDATQMDTLVPIELTPAPTSYTAKFQSFMEGDPNEYSFEWEMDRGANGSGSLYLFEVVRALSPEEAQTIPLYKERNYPEPSQYYEIVIQKDLLRDKEMSLAFYLSQVGSYECQASGSPPYLPGDQLISFFDYFTQIEQGIEYGLTGSVLCLFYIGTQTDEITEGMFVYSSNYDKMFDEIDIPMDESERRVTTSTVENKQYRGNKLTLDDLIALITRELKNRGAYKDEYK